MNLLKSQDTEAVKNGQAAVVVLTSSVIMPVISSFTEHCSDLCPNLYKVFDVSEVDESWDWTGEIDTNKVLNFNFNEADVVALVAQAKASVRDAQALRQALRVRASIDDFVTRLHTDFQETAGLETIGGRIVSGFNAVMFKHDCLHGKKTWGRDEMAVIFGEARLKYRDDGAASLAAHWLNMDINSGSCRACALSRLPPDQWLPQDGDEDPVLSDVLLRMEDICQIHGIHPKMCFDDNLERVFEELAVASDDQQRMCSDVILPLQQLMVGALHDVKFVQVGQIDDDLRISTSLVAGLTDGGYLVGAQFTFIWWKSCRN
ncbi:hypothetical protein ACHHYP_02228 [Achlya hypogyna]|uniref:Uncharacterized protein n=1 Tax=Achlya hypogyna TaxID=1202772 RepID=A0A1V9ZSB8_ACHHY|nr:hypothetical protein ACHHYP_02228 [Achlya hypogyna]